MGVLACDRKGCENIMCDRYSNRVGYICEECFSELKRQPHTLISDFMESPKGDSKDTKYWEDFLEQVFEK